MRAMWRPKMLTEWGVTYTVIESSDPESKNAAEELIIEYNRLKADNAKLLAVAKAAESVEAQFGGQLDQFGNAALDALDLALNNARDILEANNE